VRAAATASADPRVSRTRAHALAQVRLVLADRGPEGLTSSSLASVARVSRQTLYRHGGTTEALVADFPLDRLTDPATPAADAAAALTRHLDDLRSALSGQAVSAACSSLIGAAHRSPTAAAALDSVVTAQRRQLNDSLVGLAEPLDRHEYALLTGPACHDHFTARRPVTEALVRMSVQAVLSRR
jgi:AcrR family transcriptional regulator